MFCAVFVKEGTRGAQRAGQQGWLGRQHSVVCMVAAFWAYEGQELSDRVHLWREKGLSKIIRKCWPGWVSVIVTGRKNSNLCP